MSDESVNSETAVYAGAATANAPRPVFPDDPIFMAGRALTRLRTAWMRVTYPFAALGRGASIHHSCDIRRSVSSRIRIGESVYIAPHVWLNVPPYGGGDCAIIIDAGCKIGRRCLISAINRVHLENDVLLGPSVLITDHSHEFFDVDKPIHAQGLRTKGTIRVERNCWLAQGAAIICSSGDIVLGRNSVVGANCVVTRSIPPFSVVVGNPARIVKRYDPAMRKWVSPEVDQEAAMRISKSSSGRPASRNL